MKKINNFYINLIFLFCFSSFIFAAPKNELLLKGELAKLNVQNPLIDLTERISIDDFRFISLYGFSMYFPGLPENEYYLATKYGSIMIQGTSDVIDSPYHESLIDLAKKYAETYNSALLNLLKEHNVKPVEGYVPDEATAINIAIAIWIPIYGKDHIEKKKPYHAVLKNGIWYVYGSLPSGWRGGVPEAEIIKRNGKIIRISHGK